ncbi:MAG TPA: filamentous hemagglutinin N-terminal domain-containing protein, partial [Steroidobacter sp.]|nr:filamentous hemagglutinin N-terminal domain-containing protein [Steroidobacter sp.]
MNKVYRIVWNAAAGLWQVAAEFTRGRRKAAADWRLPLAAGALLLIAPPTLADLPDGGVVVGGSGAIRRSGNELTVTQNSQRLAIDWQSFSIGEGDSVRFVQPSREAAALNRVLGPDVSRILGSLDANGQVFLVNPNGVLFGANARVDVGGLVASTLDIRTEDFLAGDYRFEGDGAGSVINKGALQAAEGGYVALIAARIENAGSIEAERGQVLMGAGRKVRLDFGGPVKLEVEEAALETCIEQGGAVRADGGLIYLSAHSASELASTVINHSGVSQARSLEIGDDGEVVLLGEGATVAVTGTLDVSSARGAGGKAVVSGGRVLVDSGALIDASGAYGGGEIYLGGGWQGQDPEIPQAKGTVIMHDATVDASATEFGDGGIVAAWSDVNDNDSVTRVAGTLRARGGAQGGEGGRIETSGRELGVEAAPDVSASRGRGGEWLVDPHNITIVAGDGASGINAASPFESSGDGATLGVELIDAALASGDVVIRTGSGGSQDGDITWNPDYEYAGAADRQLSLHAHRNVALNGSIASSNGALSMTFNADSDGDGNGNLTIKESLATRGGDLSLSGQAITADVRYVTLTTSGGAGGDVDIAVAGTLLLKEVDLIAGGTGTINIDASGPNGRVELNAAKVIVEDGDLVVDAGSQILQLWRAVFASSGAGDISLTARTGNIRAGVGGTSTGHIRATGDGDIFLRSNNLLLPENSSIEGGASLFILPYDADTSIGLGDGAAGGLKLSAADLSRLDGFSLVTVGEASGSGAIELGAAELAAALRVRTGGGVTVMDEFSADAIELIAGGRVAVDSGSLSSHGGDVVITADGAFTMADGARISTGGGDFSADYGGAAQTDSVSGRIETSGGDLSLAVADSMSEDTRLYLRGATLLSEGGNILVDVGVPGGSAGELRVHALGGRNTVIDSGQGDLT